MCAILPVTWRYSGGDNVVNWCFPFHIAETFPCQHANEIVAHSYLFFLCLIKAISIVLFNDSPATKIWNPIASILYQVTLWASPPRRDVIVSRAPNMAVFALPFCFCHSSWRKKRPKPNESPLGCKFSVVGLGQRNPFGALGASISRIDMVVCCIPNMADFTSPLCWGISIWWECSNPNKSMTSCKFLIIRFGMSLVPRTFWTSISSRNSIVWSTPNMADSAFPHRFYAYAFGDWPQPFKPDFLCEGSIFGVCKSFHIYTKRCLLLVASCLDTATTIGIGIIIRHFLAVSRRNNCTISRRFVNQAI